MAGGSAALALTSGSAGDSAHTAAISAGAATPALAAARGPPHGAKRRFGRPGGGAQQ
jgi:hypothetical protein